MEKFEKLSPKAHVIIRKVAFRDLKAPDLLEITMEERKIAFQSIIENYMSMSPKKFYEHFSIKGLKSNGSLYTFAHHFVLKAPDDVKEKYEHDFKKILFHEIYPDLLEEKLLSSEKSSLGKVKSDKQKKESKPKTKEYNETKDYQNLSREIIKNRVRIEKTLASKYKVSVGVFAELFQVPGHVIEKEVERYKIKFTGKEPYNVNAAKFEFYKMVEKMENVGFSKEDSLAMFGLWTEAKYFGENIEELNFYTPEMDERIAKAIQMIEYGYTKDTVKKAMSHDGTWTMIERDTVRSATKNIDVVFGAGKQLEFADDRLQKGDAIEDIIQVNGVSKTYLKMGSKQYERMRELQKKNREERKATKEPKFVPEEIKRQAVEEYRRGYGTQKELGEKYGVAWETILAWNRQFKTEKVVNRTIGEDIVPTTRQQNMPKDKKLIMEAKRDAVVTTYLRLSSQMIKSKAIAKTSEILKCNINTVYDALRREGLIEKVFEGKRGEEHIKKSSEAYKETYSKGNLAFFGYGPNAGHHSDDDYHVRIRNQRELGYELKQEEKARICAKENEGDMTEYWAEKEKEETEDNKEL